MQQAVNFSFCTILRLVFTSDGVLVGVVIKSIEQYDLAKIKPTESEAKLHCQSRKQKRKNKPMTMLDAGLCDWPDLSPLLPIPTTCFSLDHKGWSHKWNQILPTPILSSL